MGRWVLRGVLGCLVTAAVLYLGDLGVWWVRGRPVGTVTVTRIVVAPLKGNKEEYYPDGTEDVSCSVSLFQQAGQGACWWLKGHRQVEER